MIALNETNEYAAEVPFTLPLASDPLTGLTGHTFVLGEVQIKLPSDPNNWVNVAINKIVEKGYGRFCARLTAPQCTTAGIVPILANVAGSSEQPFFGVETIGELGGDVPVGGTGYIVFYLPDAIDPVYGAPISNADFTASGTLRICLPDDVYRDATVGEKAAVINLGNGGYAFPLTTTHTVKKGKVFIYAEYPNAQRFEDYVVVLGVGASATTPPSSPTLVASSSTATSAVVSSVDHVTAALERLCEYSKRKAA